MIKIVVIGDIYVDPDFMAQEAQRIDFDEEIFVQTYNWENRSKDHFRVRALEIEKHGPEVELPSKELMAMTQDADVIITHFCPLPAKMIQGAQKLKLIGTCRGGMEHIDVAAATERGIPVIHCIRNALPVAEFVVGTILSETRNIARSHADLRKGTWQKEFPNSAYTKTMEEMTVGLVGLGYIGKLTAKKLLGMGTRVWASDPFVSQEELQKEGLNVKLVDEQTLFSSCDVISLHLRLTEKTENYVGAELIGKMKPTGYLINSARAGVVDEEALFAALREKRIGGAAIDVWWEEPISPDNRFLGLENITMTPHIAGSTVSAIPLSPRLLVEEINRFLEAGISRMVVNKLEWKGIK